jgi:outer membrane protein assembly factor BamB
MRLRCSVFSVALLLAVAACSSSAAPERWSRIDAGWTQFRMNSGHDATLPGTLRASWRVETHGAFSSSPTIAGSTLYIGNNSGALYALDVRNGRVLWMYRAASALMSNPLVWHGLVILGEGDSELRLGDLLHPFNVETDENALFALDSATGKVRWRIKVGGTAMATPAIVDGLLIDQHGGGQIIALDPRSGTVLYTKSGSGVGVMGAVLPVGSGDVVTAGMWVPTQLFTMFNGAYHNPIQRRNALDGNLRWSTDLPQSAGGIGDCPPASDGNFVFCDYVASPVNAQLYPGAAAQEVVWGIHVSSGRIAWKTTLERGARPTRNAAAIPLAFGGSVYVGSSVAPYVHAIDAIDGRVLWRARVRGPVKGGIARKGSALYFGDLTGRLWAVEARTGKLIGVKNMRTSFNVGSPVIDGETLFIGSYTGSLIAIPLDVIRTSHDG